MLLLYLQMVEKIVETVEREPERTVRDFPLVFTFPSISVLVVWCGLVCGDVSVYTSICMHVIYVYV